MTDCELVQKYAQGADQEAFGQLVGRHGGWLYSAARRRLGDGHLAEDVTQAVFLLLARRAGRLRRYAYLGGWLFVTLGYCVKQAKTREAAIRRREQEAASMRPEAVQEASWNEIAPVLETVVGRLGKADRDAVLLRFYERKPLAEVGRAMGVSEEAARKRVDRAVEKLRGMLEKQGVTGTSAGLSAVLVASVVQEVPTTLLDGVVKAVGGGGSAMAAGITKGAMRMMAISRMKVLAAIIVAGALLMGVAQVIAGRPTDKSSSVSAPTTVPADMVKYSSLTKRDIQAAVEAKLKGIRNFSVTFQEVAKKPAPDEFALIHTTFMVKGVKTYYVAEYAKDPARPDRTSRREAAYDGQVTTMRPSEFRALISRQREDETLTDRNTYYNLMMQHAGWEDDPAGGRPNSLVSIARATTTKLRPNVEMVDGHPCRVLDDYEQDRLVESVWVDCEREFLPLRQRFYLGRGSEQSLEMEYETSEAAQVQGMWFATRGRRVTYPWQPRYPNEHAPTRVSEQKIVVDRALDGTLAIRVNQSLTDDYFDLRKKLPPGTLIADMGAKAPATQR